MVVGKLKCGDCKNISEIYQEGITVCPKCGSKNFSFLYNPQYQIAKHQIEDVIEDPDNDDVVVQAIQAKMEENKKKPDPVGGCLGFIVLIGLIIWGITSCNSNSTPTPKQEHSIWDAYQICTQFVDKQLKAPGTADYPRDYNKSVTHLGGGKYTVHSYVDSHNGFGAKIRTRFDCKVQYIEGDSWKLEELNFRNW